MPDDQKPPASSENTADDRAADLTETAATPLSGPKTTDLFGTDPLLKIDVLESSKKQREQDELESVQRELNPEGGTIVYRLVERLGEGGMGVVYKAEQRSPIRRIVAVKVIKPGFDSAEVIARFESERQALARMDHPNIAKVLDADTDRRGRPYFVMEHVPGHPITKYADDNRLSIKQRLELVLQVCDAIGHAHAKAIIHRDIKASNVLAHTTPDGPRIKVIDFGVAKALTGDRLTDHTFNTARGQAIGTYECMSPEQAAGSPDIDTRTDVYSLGVLLYELLSGSKPFDKSDLARAADDEIRRIIGEDEPPRPSTQLSSMGAHATNIARARQVELEALTRQLKSELEWIPMKCLRKERDRRYASPLLLAADIRSYLAGRPLSAGPETARYRLKKLVQRNRGKFAALTVILVLLVGGIVGTSTGLSWALRERAKAVASQKQERLAKEEAIRQKERAEARFADVRQLANDFMFKFDSVLAHVNGTVPARKMLATTAMQYLDKLSRDASADKSLTTELAVSYSKVGDILGNPYSPNVGDTDQALVNYRKCLDLMLKLAQDDPQDAQAQHNLSVSYEIIGDVLAQRDQVPEALDNYTKALVIRQKLAVDHPDDLKEQRDLSVGYEKVGYMQSQKGLFDAAMASHQNALAIREKLERDHPNDPVAQRDLAIGYGNVGKLNAGMRQFDLALMNFGKALDVTKKLSGEDPGNFETRRDLAIDYQEIGEVEAAQNKPDAALENHRHSLEIRQSIARSAQGDARAEHDVAGSYQRIGDLQAALGQLDAAMESYRQLLAISQKLAQGEGGNPTAKRDVALSYEKIGDVQTAKGALNDALASYGKDVETCQICASEDPGNAGVQRQFAVAFGKIGDVQTASGQVDLALASFASMVAIFQDLVRNQPDNAAAQRDLALSHAKSASTRAQGAFSSKRPAAERVSEIRLALAEYQIAQDALSKMKSLGTSAPSDAAVLASIQSDVRACNQEILQLSKPVATQPSSRPSD